MRQRFTVIEGGGGMAAPDGDAAGAEASGGAAARSVTANALSLKSVACGAVTWDAVNWDAVIWRIVLRRAGDVGTEDVAAWRALRARSAADSVQADPDYLLAAAQHQAGGRDLVFAFAWGEAPEGEGRAAPRLHGVVPLALPHTLWGNGRASVWQPHGARVAPAIEASAFEAVRAALADHLRLVRPRLTLDLGGADMAPAPQDASRLRAVPRRATIPVHSLVGIRPPGAPLRTRPTVERITDPAALRDAVEMFLLLDAETSAAPIIGDPSEAALVRVVMRRFAQRGQASVELVRRDGVLVSGALSLGTGAEALVWRRATGGATLRIGRQA